MSSSLLSIVLPAYNVAEYVAECLDSLLNQTYKNIEIIMINDGSTDETGEICRQYAASDKRIRFVDQTNHGLPYCHELGLSLATGDLITFMDSDDYLDLDMYREVLAAMADYHADIGITGTCLVDEQGRRLSEKYTGDLWTASRTEAMRALMLERLVDSVITNKVFRRDVLLGLHFPQDGHHDDIAFCYRAFHQCQRVVHTGKPTYYYRQRQGSISYQPVSEEKLSLLKFSKDVYDFVQTNYPHLHEEAASLYYRTIKNTRAILTTHGATDQSVSDRVKAEFNAIVADALRNRCFRLRDRVTIVALKTNSYMLLKKLTRRYS